ncbi:hypothetical protein GG344DRAFT_28473, partial [Lentinula edodes]
MASVTAYSDSLPSDVPKLSNVGINWAIFDLRFTAAVKAKGKWGHFDGTSIKPSPALDKATGSPLPLTDEQLAASVKWDRDEAAAHNLLLQKIPDSAALKIRRSATVAQAWAALTKEFTEKGAFAQTDLRTAFLE